MEADFARQYYEAARVDHWWFRGRRELVAELVASSLGKAERVLDLGAGSDSLFPDQFDVVKTDIVVPSGDLGTFVRASALRLPFRNDAFDGAGAFDVIEHVAEADTLMAELARVVRPGGFIIATVPAHQWLWSPHDETVGHVQRYETQDLTLLFERNNFVVNWCGTFYGFLLLPALIRKVLGLSTGMGDPPPIINRTMAWISKRSVHSALRNPRPGLSVGLAASVPITSN